MEDNHRSDPADACVRQADDYDLRLMEALACTGFERCEFGPDGDPCDGCGKPGLQHYFGNRSAMDSREGDYLCSDCVIELHEANQAALERYDLDGFGEEFVPAIATPPIEAFREEFEKELTPQVPPTGKVGLIAPDGRFFACPWGGHPSLAHVLCMYLPDQGLLSEWEEWRVPFGNDPDSALDMLVSRGWVVIGNQEDPSGKLFITGLGEHYMTKRQVATVYDIAARWELGYDPMARYVTVGKREL